jgi:hypothetical protein
MGIAGAGAVLPTEGSPHLLGVFRRPAAESLSGNLAECGVEEGAFIVSIARCVRQCAFPHPGEYLHREPVQFTP